MAPNSLAVAGSLVNLGSVAESRGNLGAAHDLYTRAIEIRERLAPNSLAVAKSLKNLGHIAGIRSDLTAAHDYFTRALTIQERLAPHSLDVAGSLNDLGNIASIRGDLTAAHDYFTRALAIRMKLAPNSLDVAASLNGLGNEALNRGALDAAHDYFTRALAICEQLAPNSLDVAAKLNNLGAVAHERGDLTTAKDYCTRALAIGERLAPNSLDVEGSLNNLGYIALKQRRFSDSISLFRRALDTVEAQRREIKSPESRSLLAGRHTKEYAGLLHAYIELDDLPSALAIVERSRARSLVEMLSERTVDFSADAPTELAQKQQELDRRRMTAYQRLSKLDPNKDSKQIDDLRSEIEKVGIEQRRLTSEIRSTSPKYASLQYPQPFTAQQVQQTLDPGTLLLTYYIDEEQTYLFAVTRNDLGLYRLKVSRTALITQVEEFRRAVSDPRGRIELRGRELYDLLVRPAQSQVDRAQRLLICPDGILHKLPFAALVTSAAPQVRYLGEEKPLHTIVSMTVYADIRKGEPGSARESKGTVLALGDPDYPPMAVSREPSTRNGSLRGLKLTPLPHTRTELQEISRLYGKSAQVRLGKGANVAAVRQEGGKAAILHLACHGLLDDIDPLASALALSPQGENDDGMLRAYEILEKIRLNAELVTLSACETGLGQTTKHEGVIGMTRALHYAGARSVLVSLWKVADESTAALMKAFYTELKQGTPKDHALMQATAAIRKDAKHSEWRHPYYWAPFVLSGDWR